MADISQVKLPNGDTYNLVDETSGYVTTDTKNTAGSNQPVGSRMKLYLIGATSQAANPQTYSDNEVYTTDGVLQAKEYSINNGAKIVYNSIDKTIEFKFI